MSASDENVSCGDFTVPALPDLPDLATSILYQSPARTRRRPAFVLPEKEALIRAKKWSDRTPEEQKALDEFYQIAKENRRKPKYREHHDDMQLHVIKSTLLNQLNVIDVVPPSERYIHIKLMQNMLIVHGACLAREPEFVELLFRRVYQLELKYDSIVLFKMLSNIKGGNHIDNIHFRYVEDVNLNNVPPIPAEARLQIEKTLPQMRYQKQLKKRSKKIFKVGQIVGARDKENKWWLSRVLHVCQPADTNTCWYLIRFEGWNSLHDEWINSNTYRVRSFNPKKHILKRV